MSPTPASGDIKPPPVGYIGSTQHTLASVVGQRAAGQTQAGRGEVAQAEFLAAEGLVRANHALQGRVFALELSGIGRPVTAPEGFDPRRTETFHGPARGSRRGASTTGRPRCASRQPIIHVQPGQRGNWVVVGQADRACPGPSPVFRRGGQVKAGGPPRLKPPQSATETRWTAPSCSRSGRVPQLRLRGSPVPRAGNPAAEAEVHQALEGFAVPSLGPLHRLCWIQPGAEPNSQSRQDVGPSPALPPAAATARAQRACQPVRSPGRHFSLAASRWPGTPPGKADA